MARHDEFLELCAVSVSGELTNDERKKLDEHLSTCPPCRAVFDEYQATALAVIPQFATVQPLPTPPSESSWSEVKAEQRFFERLKSEDRREQFGESATSTPRMPEYPPTGYVPSPSRWGQFGMLYAALILLFVSLAISAYRSGEKHGLEAVANGPARRGDAELAQSELSDAGHDRQVLLEEIAARDKVIAGLKQQIVTQRAEHNAHPGEPVMALGATKGGRAAEPPDRAGLTTALEQLQRRLEVQESERAEQVDRANALQAKAAELSTQLQNRTDDVAQQQGIVRERDDLLEQRDKTIARQQELLAHDRDIRDLMSARDLYIAEVYDVAKTGETNKPYGRVFYTRGKSLVFYAYDLDQQAGLRNVSSFQAWGRRGASKDQALSLGILYEDSVTNKRWVVKSEDAKTLEQIDEVFVTVEPNGGSERPSGKPLLFAYLRIHPNHP
jgi:hypothetical protein